MRVHDEFIEANESRLHTRRFDGEAGLTPLLFLHEGLGSVELWRDFPGEVATRTGHPALVYSRRGYGWSDAVDEAAEPDYMHREALEVLPEIVAAHMRRTPILIGHSDGASIAIIYAGSGHTVDGLVLIAPHVFVEEGGLESIRAVDAGFRSSDLAEKMARYHRDPEATFRRWAGAWLDARFRSWNIEEYLMGIRCPILLVQCEDDEYGSLRQLDAIEARLSGRVERLVLPGSGHSPHLIHPETVTAATVRFVASIRDGSPSA
jgi:pimeloyl-ACP methyl ester carboxylesterase